MAKAKASRVDDVDPDAEGESPPAIVGGGQVRKVSVTIRGIPPGLLMCSKNGMVPESERGKQQKIDTPEVQAENAAYWTGSGKSRQLALPWVSLYKCIVAGAKRFRFKGQEKLNKIVAATISCADEMIPLGTAEYRIDSRWGRIPPKTGGVVMLNRAHVPEWAASFTLLVDDEFYPVDKLREVLAVAGKLVGVCANRPQLEGPYGRFAVEAWEVIE